MSFRGGLIAAWWLSWAGSLCFADEPLYRYEGNVVPYHKSAGWQIFNPCEAPCGESVEKGHFVLHWSQPADQVNYQLSIAQPPEKPPPTLWVEWRFLSNLPIGPNFFTCDGDFKVKYGGILEVIFMYGDTAISFSGDDFVGGLALEEFHTYRFESLDGINYTISVDGQVFIIGADDTSNGYHSIALRGGGGCQLFVNIVNEWDFVRYGTISYGERIIASDPPAGFLDMRKHTDLDRFTVTFDSANYVYIDQITVETTGGVSPVVTQTRRLDNDEPDTVEIVLDRPVPMGETTHFTFDDGVAVNVIEYTFALGDTNGNGHVDLYDIAAFQNCFGADAATSPCAALDLIPDQTINLMDYAELQPLHQGP